ncbi:hypothetical protein [Robiginitalea aurantiaca]|uniref:Uncharacterized protein n=1 Tax=Robiginitalea aurantiaca TaxID=3056915 RepID=A0ABT7WCP3_9FLAO|nr:hypothetical protein [Robiginitalea aurantiaca]MDM9630687.1 hypothetical protein [Robiginitalea aurantiaca]
MNLITKIILGLIALHLLLGFGWLIYKLMPGTPSKDDTPGGEGSKLPEEESSP